MSTNNTSLDLPMPGARQQKSILLQGFGGLKNLKVTNQEEPAVESGTVRVRVKFCGLNFLDVMARQGLIENACKPPFVLGCECTGDVEALGEDVTTLEVGDRVLVLLEQGCWAESVVAPAQFCFRLPADISYSDAAALALPYLTAHIIIRHVVGVSSGDSVLVHSAGGAVGLAMAQLCHEIGNVTLIGVASKAKHDTIKEYGFTTLIDRENDYTTEIKTQYPDGLQVVLDCLSGEDINKGISLLKPLGKYVLYGSSNFVTGETKSLFNFAKSWWKVDKINPMKLHEENKMIGGFNIKNLLFKQNQHEYVRNCLNEIFELFKNGKIKPVVDSTWAFENVYEAMQKIHDRKNIGKILLDPLASIQKSEEIAVDAADTNAES